MKDIPLESKLAAVYEYLDYPKEVERLKDIRDVKTKNKMSSELGNIKLHYEESLEKIRSIDDDLRDIEFNLDIIDKLPSTQMKELSSRNRYTYFQGRGILIEFVKEVEIYKKEVDLILSRIESP